MKPEPEVEMSSKAIDRRLRQLSGLRELGLSLEKARKRELGDRPKDKGAGNLPPGSARR